MNVTAKPSRAAMPVTKSRSFHREEALVLGVMTSTANYARRLGLRAGDLRAIAAEARRASPASLRPAIDHLDDIAVQGEPIYSTVQTLTTLLENENWLWYGPIHRLASTNWSLPATGLSPAGAKTLRRLSRGFEVADAHFVAADGLDRAALRWFVTEDGPADALYTAMNERSVRFFFAKLRELEPNLIGHVVRLANTEAARVGTPTPLPALSI